MVAISGELAEVWDWKGLAASLNINTIEIETNCNLEPSPVTCYRRELVRRYCDRQQSADPRKVAEDIAAELERMSHARQGAQLREAFSLGGWKSRCTGVAMDE